MWKDLRAPAMPSFSNNSRQSWKRYCLSQDPEKCKAARNSRAAPAVAAEMISQSGYQLALLRNADLVPKKYARCSAQPPFLPALRIPMACSASSKLGVIPSFKPIPSLATKQHDVLCSSLEKHTLLTTKMVSYHTGIVILQFIFFVPAAISSIYLCIAQGWKLAAAAWRFIAVLSLLRVAGAIAYFCSLNNPSADTLVTVVVCDLLGLAPLNLVCVGLLGRV